MYKYLFLLFLIGGFAACNNGKSPSEKSITISDPEDSVALPTESSHKTAPYFDDTKLHFEIVGLYELNEGKSCRMNLVIFKEGSTYSYRLKTNHYNYSGAIWLKENEQKNGYDFILQNIHYTGITSGEDSTVDVNKMIEGVEGVLTERKAVIRNTISENNGSLKLDDCDLKVIQLKML